MERKVQYIDSTGLLISNALEAYEQGKVKEVIIIQVTDDDQITLSSSGGIAPVEGIGILEMCKQVLLGHAFNE